MTAQLALKWSQGTQEADADDLRGALRGVDWQTRRQLCASLGWTERRLREAAELLGSEIVRGQSGFKLTASITRDDFSSASQASSAAISQGKRMIRYGLALRRRLHAVVG